MNRKLAMYVFSFAVMVVICSCAFNIDTDATPPSITGRTPAPDTTGVPTNTKITVIFSEALDTETVNTAGFTLRIGDNPVAGTVTCMGSIAEFAPSAALTAFTTYTATIAGTTADEAGNELGIDSVWSFTTGSTTDATAPTIVTRSPEAGAVNVPLTTTVSVTFSEIANATTITASSFTLAAGATTVAGSFGFSGALVTFTPAASLSPATVYTVTLGAGITDMSGNAMATVAWSFTTMDIPTHGAAGLSFHDGDYAEDQIGGDVNIVRAVDENRITKYVLYWGSSAATKLAGYGAVTSLPRTGSDLSYALPADTAIPTGATHFLVYACSDANEIAVPAALDIPDIVCRMVDDIRDGTNSSSPNFMTPSNGLLYFSATDDGADLRLWAYDGTNAPYEIPSTTCITLEEITVVGNNLFFAGQDPATYDYELWSYNGSSTSRTRDICSGVDGDSPFGLVNYSGHLCFWDTNNGTTWQFYDYNPSLDSLSSYVATDANMCSPVVLGGKLYFIGFDLSGAAEIMSYDGLSAPSNVVDINYDGSGGNPELIVYGSYLYFNSEEITLGGNQELWRCDPTADPPVAERVADLRTGAGSSPYSYCVSNGLLYFVAYDGSRYNLYEFNGTTIGLVPGQVAFDEPYSMCGYNDLLVIVGYESVNRDNLWIYDGVNPIYQASSIRQDGSDSSLYGLTQWGSRLYFSADNGNDGSELWVFFIK